MNISISSVKFISVVVMLFSIMSVSQIYAQSAPSISLNIQNSAPSQGQSNLVIGTISGSGSSTDYILVCGSSNTGSSQAIAACTAPNNYLLRIGVVQGGTSYNTQSLSSGAYSFEACDYTYWETQNMVDCTAPQTVNISPSSSSSSTSTMSTTSTATTTPSSSTTLSTTAPTTTITQTTIVSSSANKTLTVIYNPAYGTVNVRSHNGSCGYQNAMYTCVYSISQYSNVTISATTMPSTRFLGWGACGGGCIAKSSGNYSVAYFTMYSNGTVFPDFVSLPIQTVHSCNKEITLYLNQTISCYPFSVNISNVLGLNLYYKGMNTIVENLGIATGKSSGIYIYGNYTAQMHVYGTFQSNYANQEWVNMSLNVTNQSKLATSSITIQKIVQKCAVNGIIKGTGEIELYNSSAADYSTHNTSFLVPCGSLVYIYGISGNLVNWTCSGNGCYSGTVTRISVQVNNNITETANFGNITSSPTLSTTITPTTTVAPTSGSQSNILQQIWNAIVNFFSHL